MVLRTLLFLSGLLIMACKKEPEIKPIDYATAYKLSPIDTMRSIGVNGEIITHGFSKSYRGLVGAQLPSFAATTLDGKQIDSSYFEDKVSVINFWFEGCMPCEHEMPVFNQLVEKYKGKDINFLAIGKNSPKDINDFLLRKPFHFDHIAYGEPIIQDTFGSMWGYPITIVADKDQKIVLISRGLGDTTKVTDAQVEFVAAIDKALVQD